MEVKVLANIKSAKKRISVIETKTLRNKMIASGDKAAAQASLKVATSEIGKAASKGIYHKNNAARKVARLSAAVSKMA